MQKTALFPPRIILHAGIPVVLLVLVLLNGCSDESRGSGRNEKENQVLPLVEALNARHGSLPLSQRLSGVVKAENQVDIYPRISATVVEVLVNNGEQVRKGQPMLRLRDTEFRERMKQAEAALNIARAQTRQAEARLKEQQAELRRIRDLAAKEVVSAADLEAAETLLVSAEADVELARARVEQARAAVDESGEALSETLIRAPVAGTVGNRDAEIGMLVSANSRLFTVGQLAKLRVEVALTDRMLEYIHTGQRAEITPPGKASASFSATLSRISPFLHPLTHSTIGEIDLQNPGGILKPGMFVSVDIYYGESEQATLVPLSALYEHPATGVSGVYIAAEQNAGAGTQNGEAQTTSQAYSFEFVPVELAARGRLHAGVRGIGPDALVITLGQNLLGGEPGRAQVRRVEWQHVEALQQVQRQDLMESVARRQREEARESDTTRH